MMRRLCVVVFVLSQAAALAGCSRGPSAAAPSTPASSAPGPALPPSGLVPAVSLKELMDATVDPAADGLWDAVATISTTAGIEQRQPRTPQEWAAVRRHAVTLIEAMNLVMMPGRHAAPAGTQPGLGELPPEQIDLLIERQRAQFTAFANGVRATAGEALEAIDRRDIDALFKAGSDIDLACEACHVTFWYPQQH